MFLIRWRFHIVCIWLLLNHLKLAFWCLYLFQGWFRIPNIFSYLQSSLVSIPQFFSSIMWNSLVLPDRVLEVWYLYLYREKCYWRLAFCTYRMILLGEIIPEVSPPPLHSGSPQLCLLNWRLIELKSQTQPSLRNIKNPSRDILQNSWPVTVCKLSGSWESRKDWETSTALRR